MTATDEGRTYPAHLERIIDGDTVVMRIDLGFRLTATLPIRLVGIDCPEKATPEGKSAAAAASKLLGASRPCQVITFKNPEKYGRWLGRIRLPDGEDLAEQLFLAGHAVRYDGGKRR